MANRNFGLYVFLLLKLSAPATGAQLLADVRRVEITPPAGVISTWGYGSSDSHNVAKDALDPLYAHVLYLRGAEGETLAWVDLDCGRTFGIPTQDLIRKELESSVQHVFFSATHTHSGPFFKDDLAGVELPPWERSMISKIVAAVREASVRPKPVKIGFATGAAVIGYNRRLVRSDGSVTMLAGIDGNQAAIANGPTDPTFAVLRLDDAQTNEPLAIVVNATAHPVIRRQVDMFSADYPGVVRSQVSSAFASRPVCFFLQGAAGDINPQRPPAADRESDDGVRQLGESFAKRIVMIARSIMPREPRSGSLGIIVDHVPAVPRWPTADFSREFSNYKGYVDHFSAYHQLPMAVILIDGEIGWAVFPGEFFVQLQLDFRARSPLAQTFFVGYSNGYFGYFPTIEAAAEGGYGANNIMAAAAPGTAEQMVDRALVDLDRLLGRLTDKPATPGQTYRSTWKRP